MSSPRASAYLRICLAVELAGASLVIVATAVMPWSTYRVKAASSSQALHTDSLWPVLISAAVVALIVGALQLVWPTRALAFTAVMVGLVAVGLSVAEAASRIAHANSLTLSAGGETSYAGGSAAAVFGALSFCAAAIVINVARSRS